MQSTFKKNRFYAQMGVVQVSYIAWNQLEC